MSLPTKPAVLKIWTDGAYRDKGKPKLIGMAAVYCYRGPGQRKDPEIKAWTVKAKKTSSMHAELFAIQCAIEYIPKDVKQTCNVIIVSDCLDAVNAIHHGNIKERYSKIVTHIQELLMSCHHAHVVWCKGHTCHRWNLLADAAAKKAVSDEKSSHPKRTRR